MLRTVPLGFLVLALAACASRPQATPDEREARLLHVLDRADQNILVTDLSRDGDGILVVTTRQGVETVRYRLEPAGESLRIARIEDRVLMPGIEDACHGTGPDDRGLARP